MKNMLIVDDREQELYMLRVLLEGFSRYSSNERLLSAGAYSWT
jgi:hypothetical protein